MNSWKSSGNASKEQERLAEEERKALEEANRRAITGEGMIRQTAPSRALGIGEIMTSGRAARGGSPIRRHLNF